MLRVTSRRLGVMDFAKRVARPEGNFSPATARAEMSKPIITNAYVLNNRYKTKRTWPPIYDHLSPQQKLYFEKKYKRRANIVYSCPRWTKAIKLAQFFSITVFILYMLLVAQPDADFVPFYPVSVKAISLLWQPHLPANLPYSSARKSILGSELIWARKAQLRRPKILAFGLKSQMQEKILAKM